MGAISYQCLHGHKHLIHQCQTNGHDQLSMTTQTQVLDRSTPNQWVRSAIHDYTDTSTRSINANPMGAISYQGLHGHKHSIHQCQTNGHDQLSRSTRTQAHNRSMPNQWAQSDINVYMDTSK